ncbi:MAG: hypothetical protein V4605_02440 [Pseudomonadota bacterium]
MSKIPPLQAQALGLKPVPTIAKENKSLAKKDTATSVAKVAVKPHASLSKSSTKSAAKPSAKPVAFKANVAKKESKKDDKKPKSEKVKMERDSFTMPKDEYAQLTLLKVRLTSMGQPAKKSELLRAGIKLLAAMSDNTLKTTLAKIPVIKTGRPNKKG